MTIIHIDIKHMTITTLKGQDVHTMRCKSIASTVHNALLYTRKPNTRTITTY